MKFLLFVVLLIPFYAHAQQYIERDSMVVKGSKFEQLDTLSTKWQLDDEQIVRYFQSAKQIENLDAAKIIVANYSPFVIEGQLNYNETDFQFIITSSGVGILRSDTIHRYYIYNEYPHQSVFLNKRELVDLDIFLLSQRKVVKNKYVNNESDFYNWCKLWKLSASDFNKYFKLCEQMSQTELYQRFQNYPCWLEGYLVWNGEIFFYRLDSSAPLWLQYLDEDSKNKEIGFGCFDRIGEKYVFEIDPILGED